MHESEGCQGKQKPNSGWVWDGLTEQGRRDAICDPSLSQDCQPVKDEQ